MSKMLKCGTHGAREKRFVCDHLFQNGRSECPKAMVYFEPEHADDEPTPAIWCEACEVVIMEQGEVNDAAADFADFHLVCDFCFQTYLDNNRPAPLE